MLDKEQKAILEKCEIKKDGLREEALKNDYLRLKSKIKRISKIILLQRVMLIVFLVVGCFFLYSYIKPTKFTYDKTIVLQSPAKELKKEKPNEKILEIDSIYNIQFKNQNSYTLISVKTKKEALIVLSQFEKMNFPRVTIVKQAKEETDSKSIENNKYYLQLGAYNHNYLSSYTNEFVDLLFIEEKGYFKYALGPFSGFTGARKMAINMHLKDYYICKYTQK